MPNGGYSVLGIVNWLKKFFKIRLENFIIRNSVFLVGLFLSIGFGYTGLVVANSPFPHIAYPYGIKPDNLSQNVMNNRVQTLYGNWKAQLDGLKVFYVTRRSAHVQTSK